MGTTIYLIFSLVLATINLLKGKYWMIIFSFGIIGLITAIRVAKPDSYWDSHWSSVGDHQKAVSRFTRHSSSL